MKPSSKEQTLDELIALIPEQSRLRSSDTFARALLGKLNVRELLALKDAMLLMCDPIYRKHVARMVAGGNR